jgi:hypothetical protein
MTSVKHPPAFWQDYYIDFLKIGRNFESSVVTNILNRNIGRNAAVLVLLCMALLDGDLTLGSESAGTNAFEIQILTNCETLYTTYDFMARKDGKRMEKSDLDYHGTNIWWEVVDRVGNPKPKKFMYVCPEEGSFSANIQINRTIMREIFSRWPVSDFDSVEIIGPLGGPPDWSWEIPIAVASSKSDDYEDFKAHYPHSRITSLFVLYRQLADQTKAYNPVQEIFREAGADIEFEGGEKAIMNARAEDLPFYPQLKARGVSGKTRVIYGAIGNAFTIKPLSDK